jgi:purine-binding chemotaxis protein CheW
MAELTASKDKTVKAMVERAGKYLTFTLAGEEYGIGILKIKEIIGMMPVTTVSQTPEFVKGVINLRGKVIPVVELRRVHYQFVNCYPRLFGFRCQVSGIS